MCDVRFLWGDRFLRFYRLKHELRCKIISFVEKNPWFKQSLQCLLLTVVLYTTFIMADIARVLDRVAWKRGQKGQTIASRPSSFVMASTSNISNPTFLTENDIPGASLLGRKPEELKISEIKFWLKCCGDAVKRGHDYIQPWFLGWTRAETAFILLWTFY